MTNGPGTFSAAFDGWSGARRARREKLFGWFGGPGLDAIGQGFAALGFHPGKRQALIAGLVEVGGGLLLTLGLLTPLAAAIVLSVMLVAAVSVHVKQGFFITSGGFEYNLVLGMAGLVLAFTGPGALSLDALFGLTVTGAFWAPRHSSSGSTGAGVQLAQRRSAPALQPAHAE